MKVILLTENKKNKNELNILASFTGEGFVAEAINDITVNKKGFVFYCLSPVTAITIKPEHSNELHVGGSELHEGTWRCSFVGKNLQESLDQLTTVATTFEENDYGSKVRLNTLSRVVLEES
mgnify:CR=1 FL=1